MPPKKDGTSTSPWANAPLLENLVVAFVGVTMNAGALNSEAKEAIVQFVKDNGGEITWEGIR